MSILQQYAEKWIFALADALDKITFPSILTDYKLLAMIFGGVIGGATLLFLLIINFRIFRKAGCHGISCLIPIWSLYCYAKILFGRGWTFWLYVIPGVNLIMLIITPFRMARVFGRGVLFGLGYSLFPTVFQAIIAFGELDYCGPNG